MAKIKAWEHRQIAELIVAEPTKSWKLRLKVVWGERKCDDHKYYSEERSNSLATRSSETSNRLSNSSIMDEYIREEKCSSSKVFISGSPGKTRVYRWLHTL